MEEVNRRKEKGVALKVNQTKEKSNSQEEMMDDKDMALLLKKFDF